MNQSTPDLVLYGHTYLSRAHATVQCMTMCKGTVDGKKFAKSIHADLHATAPVKIPLSPSRSMLMRTTAQNASVSEQRKLRKTNCSAHTPTLNVGARGVSCRCVCTAKCISKCHLLEFESFANLFPSTVKNQCVAVCQSIARKCLDCLCWVCVEKTLVALIRFHALRVHRMHIPIRT